MTRSITDPAAANRGSRKWLQILVNCRPELLNDAIAQRLHELPDDIDWRCPHLGGPLCRIQGPVVPGPAGRIDVLPRSNAGATGSHGILAPLRTAVGRPGRNGQGTSPAGGGQGSHSRASYCSCPSPRGICPAEDPGKPWARVKNFVNSKAPVDWSTSFLPVCQPPGPPVLVARDQRPRRLPGQPLLHQRP